MTNAELLALCEQMGVGVKTDSSTLIEQWADQLRRQAEREGLTRPEQPGDRRSTRRQEVKRENLTDIVNDCEDYGIPVMAVTAVGKELEKRDARYLGLCSRICAELGARVVKTYWCENFDKVTNGCPVPVVMAGGPKCETEREVFEFVHDGMERGAIGVNLGRNVWQAPHPVPTMKGLYSIIHEEASVDEAVKIFESAKAEGL